MANQSKFIRKFEKMIQKNSRFALVRNSSFRSARRRKPSTQASEDGSSSILIHEEETSSATVSPPHSGKADACEDWDDYFERATISAIKSLPQLIPARGSLRHPAPLNSRSLTDILSLESFGLLIRQALGDLSSHGFTLDAWLRNHEERIHMSPELNEILFAVGLVNSRKKKHFLSERVRKELKVVLAAEVAAIERTLVRARKRHAKTIPVFAEDVTVAERDAFIHVLGGTGLFSHWSEERVNVDVEDTGKALQKVHPRREVEHVLSACGRPLLEGWIDLHADSLRKEWLDVQLHIGRPFLEKIFRRQSADNRGRLLERFRSTHDIIEPEETLEQVILPEERRKEIASLCDAHRRELAAGRPSRLTFLFRGIPGTGKTMLAKAIANRLGQRLLRLNAVSVGATVLPTLVALLAERARHRNCVLLVDECEDLLTSNPFTNSSDAWGKILFEEFEGAAVFTTNFNVPTGMDRRMTYILDFKGPAPGLRERMLVQEVERFRKQRRLKSVPLREELEQLARKSKIPAGYMGSVLELAGALSPAGTLELGALRTSFSQREATLAGPSESAKTYGPKITLEDVKLGKSQRESLDRFVEFARTHLAPAANQAGGNPLLPRGVTALFCGASGTGKTIAADAVAQALGMELKRVSPSTFLSMFVGGTEARIKQAFAEAEENGHVLFLDEAEGLLRDRDGARQAWELTQVDEFLQQLEQFKGVFIAATNHAEMLDSAFGRRFLFKIQFEMPAIPERIELWSRFLGVEARSPMIGELAREFVLSGGEIRNVALQALALGLQAQDASMQPRFAQLCEEAIRTRTGRKTAPMGIQA